MNCNTFLADRYLKCKCYHCHEIANGDQCDYCGNLLEIDKLTELWCSICKNQPLLKSH